MPPKLLYVLLITAPLFLAIPLTGYLLYHSVPTPALPSLSLSPLPTPTPTLIDIYSPPTLPKKPAYTLILTGDSMTATIAASSSPFTSSPPLVNHTVNLTLQKFHLPSPNFTLKIKSDIPQNCGLGSSASVAASVISALSQFLSRPLTRRQLNHLVFTSEHFSHHSPSGADNSAVVYGGLLGFQPHHPLRRLPPLTAKLPLLLINSGISSESTASMVDFVADRLRRYPLKTKQLLHSLGNLTSKFTTSFQYTDFSLLPQMIHQNHLLLTKLGIVSPSTQKLIKQINSLGGVAKVCGAGGRTTGSGILLCYHPNIDALITFAKKHNLQYFQDPLAQRQALQHHKHSTNTKTSDLVG